jgi:hypothetical protein
MNKKRKLIIHVGMEKTGTSSIQYTAKRNVNNLKGKGIFYLGLMLEEFEVKKFHWQNVRGWRDFISQGENIANREIVSLFNEINDKLPDSYHTLVWSNESLFNRIDFLRAALGSLTEKFTVEVICYIRKPDAWIQSAYLQWGIKHKAYSGTMKSFSEWVQHRSFPVLEFVNKWKKITLSSCFYNFDNIENITEHFYLEYLNLSPTEFDIVRLNDTPTPAQLALFTLFNSSFNEEVLPYRIENLFSKNMIPVGPNSPVELSDLVASQAELDRYCESIASETQTLDTLFENPDTQSISGTRTYKLKDLSYNQPSINLELLKLCLSMNERIEELEKALLKGR